MQNIMPRWAYHMTRILAVTGAVTLYTGCTGAAGTSSSYVSSAASAGYESSFAAESSSIFAVSSTPQMNSSSNTDSSHFAVVSSSSSAQVHSSSVAGSSSSSAASSDPIELIGCELSVQEGEPLYMENCSACHGNVPTDGETVWSKGSNSIDVFDSGNDGYQPRGGGKQMLAFNDFVAMYMPDTSNGIGQDKADSITAYITATVNQPWCSGDDWPEPEQGSSSSVSGNLANYRKGEVIYRHNFNNGNRKQWTGGEISADGVLVLATPADAGHGGTVRLAGLADWKDYPDKIARDALVGTIPNHFNNSIIEFDFKYVKGTSIKIVFDDGYASRYTHAGHISRVQIDIDSVSLRDDVGGVFGIRQIEKSGVTGADLDKVTAEYYPDLAEKGKKKAINLKMQQWYHVRVVLHESRLEFHIAERGQPPEFQLALNSPGKIEGYLPQPKVDHADEIGRKNKQPRGLDHFISTWGWTGGQGDEIHFDNIKIWSLVPE